jgi:hypothetical protein
MGGQGGGSTVAWGCGRWAPWAGCARRRRRRWRVKLRSNPSLCYRGGSCRGRAGAVCARPGRWVAGLLAVPAQGRTVDRGAGCTVWTEARLAGLRGRRWLRGAWRVLVWRRWALARPHVHHGRVRAGARPPVVLASHRPERGAAGRFPCRRASRRRPRVDLARAGGWWVERRKVDPPPLPLPPLVPSHVWLALSLLDRRPHTTPARDPRQALCTAHAHAHTRS